MLNHQQPGHTHALHPHLHGRLSTTNGLVGVTSDDDDMEEDEDIIDGDGEADGISVQHGHSRGRTRGDKGLTSQVNGDKSGKPRKKKTRTVFSRSQVNFVDAHYSGN